MAYLTLDTRKLNYNYRYLNTRFKRNNIDWAIVSKLLCGNELYLSTLAELGISQICDSRITNLKAVRKVMPEVETIFIKPPTPRTAARIAAYADISCNTSIATIQALSEAAVSMGIVHRIIIMVETGELREGVLPENLSWFYRQIKDLPGIRVIGLGTNHACMYGVLPSFENLQTLENCRKMLITEFGCELELLSGGASVAIPLIGTEEMPKTINHFRVGETLFFGMNVFDNTPIPSMKQDIFMLHANIIELRQKPTQPFGNFGFNLTKDKKLPSEKTKSATSSRAILDVGLLDLDVKHLIPTDESITISGASSDMMVVDLGKNEGAYRIGDTISFRLDYMGALRAINSRYIDKRVLADVPEFQHANRLVLAG